MDLLKLEEFVCDTRVQYCKGLGESQNVFDIVSLNENGHSNLLAWLFDPRESHGLGDSFFHELFRQVYAAKDGSSKFYKKALQENKFFQWWDISDVEEASFQNSLYVKREFDAGEYGQIDLLMIDYSHEIVVIIENKFGSSIQPEQLKRYFRFLNEGRFKEYYLVYVYLDPKANEKLEGNDPEYEHWVGLDYEWVESFCKRVVDKKVLSKKANYLLEDYRLLLSKAEYGVDAPEEVEGYLFELLGEYSGLIESIKNYKIQVKGKGTIPLLDMSVIELAEYIPLIENDDESFVVKIYLKYSDVIDHLIFSSKTSYLEQTIIARCPGYKLDFDSRDKFFAAYNSAWDRFSNERSEVEEKWCFYPCLEFNRDGESEDRNISVRLYVHGRYLKDKYVNALLKVFKEDFDFSREQFFDGTNTIKIAEGVENEAEVVDKLIALIKQLSQALQII